ncbi:unnamed protein product [Ambrosiozyma monospora]|uniref:Unnamed protein product n=1 Tax=Ambrosiozyma monospora TaxID=43982 RepID=A0A9W6YTA1_AMBMO|nr:unnamed protein product [Ambrosiozyma monospora]
MTLQVAVGPLRPVISRFYLQGTESRFETLTVSAVNTYYGNSGAWLDYWPLAPGQWLQPLKFDLDGNGPYWGFEFSIYHRELHLSAYLAGAFFPDAYYNCLGLSDEAEEAHWPPFLQASVNYYRDEYTSKGLENTELKSFLYGIFTHQVTDLSWHSLHSRQGLLQMLQYLEYDGDYNKAHTFLDPAGDFIVLSKQLRNLSKEKLHLLTEFYRHDWSIPSDDLIEIYHRLGYDTITHGNLNLCVMTGYSALQGEFTSSLITTPKVNYYLNESPMLDEVLLEYYYGGISEIVTTTRTCFEQLDSWFDNGIEDPPFPHTQSH